MTLCLDHRVEVVVRALVLYRYVLGSIFRVEVFVLPFILHVVAALMTTFVVVV